jgi:hypothetical protein
MMALLFGFGMANHLGGPAGLMEKLATVVRTTWPVLLVARLLAGSRLGSRTRSTSNHANPSPLSTTSSTHSETTQ